MTKKKKQVTKIESVEIVFTSGLHIRVLPKPQEAIVWTEHKGWISQIERGSIRQLIDVLQRVDKE